MTATILVTGASGFVGGNFARLAARAGYRVLAQFNRNRPSFDSGEKIELLQHNLGAKVPDWPAVDLIYHAATNANAENVSTLDLVYGNTIVATNLLEWMQRTGSRRCFFCSSVSVFGQISSDLLDEDVPRVNPSPYGTTKFLAEQAFQERSDKVLCLAARLPSVLGPHARGTWLTRVAADLLSGREIRIFNPDSLFNNAVHVEDLFRLGLSLLEKRDPQFDVVTVGAGSSLPVRGVVQEMARSLGVEPKMEIDDTAKSSFTISSRKAIERYGYDPMPIDEMVRAYSASLETAPAVHARGMQ